MRQALSLIYPTDLIREPIIYKMSREFDVVFNLRRGKINEKVGEIVLELEGDATMVKKAVDWLKSKGLKVDPVTHDTLES